ncbi:MAG: Na+:solute symporter [Flavobacteriales bacterium]|nr:Na+:solute symporter [Flavobacteriales bacterium]MDG1780546.1 Na+:solute symporter [Flavobacteriales bacterium]MDG2245763.1 Na+:solute symporter [Flavobacteriales bacterium]
MQLELVDWSIIIAFFVVSLLIGIYASRKAGKSSAEFFLSGRNMPWWLLGVSMVATTFSADTPNFVADIVRTDGVASNWMWWAFLLTGMLTVFVYAKLWRRSGVATDIEFYELRYSGKEAAFLRGFRAIYLGVFFNVVIMATVCLAATKIGGILLGVPPWQTLLVASVVTVFYSALGGLRGVILTDFVQFFLAMIGSVGAAIVIVNLPEVGGLEKLLAAPQLEGKLDLIPSFENTDLFLSVFLIPLAVQWWSVWYPGSEPGGGGYVAQRMLSAKDEKNALGATLLFNIAHFALRPWPWIIIALASLVVFPELDDIMAAFPNSDQLNKGHDLAYPAMLSYLPAGLLGLVVASLIAAFMSTISTHLNWGASYVVNDFYKRFIAPDASERSQVMVGRLATVLLMLFAALTSLLIETASDGFNALLQIGAGTGLIFILRWFWWRINAWTEISGMVISFLYALSILLLRPELDEGEAWMLGSLELTDGVLLIGGVLITTIGWLITMFLTRPTSKEVLSSFYHQVKPAGKGWKKVLGDDIPPAEGKLPNQLVSMLLGTAMVYSALFAVGKYLYGETAVAGGLALITLVCAAILWAIWRTKK